MKTWLQERTQPTNLVGRIILLILNVAGVLISLRIYLEKLELQNNPNYVPSCSVDGIITCSKVMDSQQAAAFFGIPNPLIGIVGFTLLTILTLITFKYALPNWVNVLTAVGTAGALIFCFWLATQALYVIVALCVWCFAIWLITSILFWTYVNALLKTNEVLQPSAALITHTARIITIAVFLFMIWNAFPDYWMERISNMMN